MTNRVEAEKHPKDQIMVPKSASPEIRCVVYATDFEPCLTPFSLLLGFHHFRWQPSVKGAFFAFVVLYKVRIGVLNAYAMHFVITVIHC